MTPRHLFPMLAGLTTLALSASAPSPRHPDAESITPNDNRKAAGTLAGRVLTVQLEARAGTFYPEGPTGVGVPAFAWSEVGRPLQSPGPLIRVEVGTTVKASIHNALAKPLTVYGLAKERGFKDSLVIAPDSTAEAEFLATTPGTYYYAGQTVPGPIRARIEEDGQLNGAIVVDPPDAPANDRIFLISWWFTLDSTSRSGLGRGTMAINGLSWPHTERIDAAQNDSLHWRWINATSIDHPMHLHGFYYRVDAMGNGVRDTILAPADRRMTVTEIVGPGQTMDMTWSPNRPGNWIFHCHFAGHLSYHVSMDTYEGVPHPEMEHNHMSDAPHQMYGLVLGIRVAPSGPVAAAPKPARTIRLVVREKSNVYGDHPGYAFVLGGTPAEKNPEAMPVPGPPIVLVRGQPVAVNIVNQSQDHAAVHWHGIELQQSYPDGVPGWSGIGNETLPALAPGDSLTVRFTPPRAGTFMYHSHFNEFQQITCGLYGPIIVLEPGQKYDPETDRVLLFSDGGPTTNVISGPFPPMLLNGQVQPDPIDLKTGVKYRFRVIGITGDISTQFKFLDGDKPIEWRAVARDGMTLPPSQATVRPAAMIFDPGQIFDFEYTPKKAGQLAIEYGEPAFGAPPDKAPKQTRVEVRVATPD
ncbi:MAG TPA: multicopper oxidase domain-containing protein [Gemmatimonadales bacterium]|nr:multicopper oxidase domain-containing protein [Gemmatimonadales bacterium]